MFERVHSFSWRYFYWRVFTRHKFTVKYRIYFYIVMFLHDARARSQFHSHLRGIDEVWCAWNLSRHRSLHDFRTRYRSLAKRVSPRHCCLYRIITAKMYVSAIEFLHPRTILATKDCLFPIDSRGSLDCVLQAVLCTSLQPRKTLSQGSDIISLLQQVAFNFHNFHYSHVKT